MARGKGRGGGGGGEDVEDTGGEKVKRQEWQIMANSDEEDGGAAPWQTWAQRWPGRGRWLARHLQRGEGGEATSGSEGGAEMPVMM